MLVRYYTTFGKALIKYLLTSPQLDPLPLTPLTFPVVVRWGAVILMAANPLFTSRTLNPRLTRREAAMVDRNPPKQKAMYCLSLGGERI